MSVSAATTRFTMRTAYIMETTVQVLYADLACWVMHNHVVKLQSGGVGSGMEVASCARQICQGLLVALHALELLDTGEQWIQHVSYNNTEQ